MRLVASARFGFFSAVLLGFGLAPTTSASAADGDWRPLPPPGSGRIEATGTALSDGRILVVGGIAEQIMMGGTTSADVFDPATSTWRAIAPTGQGHIYAHAVALSDGALLFGPATSYYDEVIGERWDAATDVWQPLPDAPWWDSFAAVDGAVPLGADRVLVVASTSDFDGGQESYASVFDAASSTWQDTGPFVEPRVAPALAVLNDGRVLAIGGHAPAVQSTTLDYGPALATTEVLDPATGQWTAGPALSEARFAPQAALLRDGTVLVVGGGSAHDRAEASQDTTAEVLDLTTGTATPTDELRFPRSHSTVVALDDGRALVVGGVTDGDCPALSTSEVFDPASGTWQETDPMTRPRIRPVAVAIPGGQALVVGGGRNDDCTYGGAVDAELYAPSTNDDAEPSTPSASRVGPTGDADAGTGGLSMAVLVLAVGAAGGVGAGTGVAFGRRRTRAH
jgi:hypothetical protein